MIVSAAQAVYLCVFAPLIGGLVVGLLGKRLNRVLAHRVAILFMLISFASALFIAKYILLDHQPALHLHLFNWVIAGSYHLQIGLLVDQLTAMMMLVVTFVATLVHVYSIGYMSDDPGYQRFFSYVSVFTFAMLSLVSADNFVLLFFGWEGVGLISYLLIGFWFEKETAVFGSLKAFIVNRVGDLGFILGLALILYLFNTLDYAPVFKQASSAVSHSITLFPGVSCSAITLVCILLFIGAAGKSAQMPLHVWLPESMEGPTPISALIHAATMVTAGVYLVCRMSPLFQLSEVSQTLIVVLGGLTALFTGILGVFQYDIKRVIAYSTLSQLGYMMVGAGISAYNAAMFHLMMHACFKALLFLAAGSVIIGMHHEQDMRKMGGLWKYMPITWVGFAVGGLALSAIPPFSGFFSKDSIIDAAHFSHIPGGQFAYWCVLLGAFVTALYTFRGFFMTFHGKPRFHGVLKGHVVKESPWVMTLPIICLAIPSTVLGGLLIHHLLYASPSAFGHALLVLPQYDVLLQLKAHFHGAADMMIAALTSLPFWFAISGVVVAWLVTIGMPERALRFRQQAKSVMFIFDKKFGFDDFNQIVLVRGTQKLAKRCYYFMDLKFLDSCLVLGAGRLVLRAARRLRDLQTGYIYHYVFAMLVGVFLCLLWIHWGMSSI